VPIAAVIHHGLDASAWPVGSGDGGYVLFLGRMNPDKGVHRAIAFARSAGIPLVIAAKMREPAEMAYFEEEVRPLLHDETHFVGEADAVTKRQLLAGAIALLNPITWPEPFGLVMVEALACGTPVITSPLGAAGEIVEEGVNGFLCGSKDAFVAALAEAPSLDRMACRASVVERFPVERMVEAHEWLYRRLCHSADLGSLPADQAGASTTSSPQSWGSPRTSILSPSAITSRR
jgi:glycosyltransferase involved in cell wall biosynthesis